MNKEELQKVEYERFIKDFEALINRHKYAFETLGMGVQIEYTSVDMRYKHNEHCVYNSGQFKLLETQNWHD